MNPIQNRPTAADAEPERLVSGPSGTKILQTPAAARAMKARGRGHAGLKVSPRPASATDAEAAITSIGTAASVAPLATAYGTAVSDATDAEREKANAL